MESLNPFLTFFLFLVVVAAMFFIVRKIRVSELQNVKISDADAARLSAALMAYVKAEAYGVDTKIDLTPFWRKKKLSEADKAFVLIPHFQTRLLLVEKVTEPWGAVQVERFTDWIFLPVQRFVYLNPQEWTRMTTGKPVNHVHGDQYYDHRSFDQSIHDNSGPVTIGSVFSGDDGVVTVSGSANNLGLTTRDMEKLSEALYLDSRNLQPVQALPVRDLALEVEQAVSENSTSRFSGLVQRASGLAGLANGVLSATQSVVDLLDPSG